VDGSALGRRGEDAALERYLARGYFLLARNWRCRSGELDLILVDPAGTVVVCEVKARRGSAFGGGFEAVTAAKRRRIRGLAQRYLLGSARPAAAVRFDVASVHVRIGESPDVQIFEDAF
jgi:putative endonuclease